jgi:murein DD-endopeptidase MepM/ murein hydrolase activator NlpD
MEHNDPMAVRKTLASDPFTFLLIFFAGLILSACAQVSTGAMAVPTTIPSGTLPSNGLSPSLTPFIATIFTTTFTKTGTPVGTTRELPSPSFTQSDTPTETPQPFIYVFPIQPPESASFAEGLASHGYPATDIFAPEGTKFVAVTDGVVNFVSSQDDWDPLQDDPALRGGLSVAIIGDDGVRYYGSHLSAIRAGISPGVRVTAGQVLGYIGHTGDARNTEFHLHFGISRPSSPDDWKARRGQVDPYPFLFSWRAGQNVTPPLPTP